MTAMDTIFTKTTGSGHAVEVAYDGERVIVTLDGKNEFEGRVNCHGLYSTIGTSLGKATTIKAGLPEGSYSLGRIIITPDEMAAIMSAVPCSCSEYDRMERERTAYIATLEVAPRTCESDYADGIDSPSYWTEKRRELRTVEARSQAIKAWDDAHPEHATARRQRRADDVARTAYL
jgi:hypothetical protein